MPTTTTPYLERSRELLAELLLLERYDAARAKLGHDYGGGQRRAELMRREQRLRARGAQDPLVSASRLYRELELELEMELAWDRIARPRIRRLERETFRHGTTSTERSLRAWLLVANRYGAPMVAPAGSA